MFINYEWIKDKVKMKLIYKRNIENNQKERETTHIQGVGEQLLCQSSIMKCRLTSIRHQLTGKLSNGDSDSKKLFRRYVFSGFCTLLNFVCDDGDNKNDHYLLLSTYYVPKNHIEHFT